LQTRGSALAVSQSLNIIRWQMDVWTGPTDAQDALVRSLQHSSPVRFAGLALLLALSLPPHRADWLEWLAAGSGRGRSHTPSPAARRRLAFHDLALRCNHHAAFACCPHTLTPPQANFLPCPMRFSGQDARALKPVFTLAFEVNLHIYMYLHYSRYREDGDGNGGRQACSLALSRVHMWALVLPFI